MSSFAMEYTLYSGNFPTKIVVQASEIRQLLKRKDETLAL